MSLPIGSFPIQQIQRGQKYLLVLQGYGDYKQTMFHNGNVAQPRIYFRDPTTRNVDFGVFGFTNDNYGAASLLPFVQGASVPKEFSFLLDNPYLFYLDPNMTQQLVKPAYIAEVVLFAQYAGTTSEYTEVTVCSSQITTVGTLNAEGLA